MDRPADWFSILDRISDFNIEDATLDKWHEWHRQFNIVLRATAFDNLPNRQKVAILMMKCKGFIPVWNILDIDDNTVEYDVMVSEIIQYLNPVNARIVLSQRKQGENESFDSFARALEALSRPCQYRDKNIVRDVFIANMDEAHADIARAIRQKYDISLNEAVALANAMVSQGCFSNAREVLTTNDFSFPRYSSPSSLVNAPSSRDCVLNIRMMPIITGRHEVRVISIDHRNGMVFVCPTSMMNARQDFLKALNRSMESCKDPAVTPLKNSSYAALINCNWYRVKVQSIEVGKKAKILATDFGWTTKAPFSVFRNLPLDFRPVEPLLWMVTFNSPMPGEVRDRAVLNVDLSQMSNNWVASLIPRMSKPIQSVDKYDSDTSYLSHQHIKPVEEHERRGVAASDVETSENRQRRNGQVERDSYRTGRTQERMVTNGRNDDKNRSRRARSEVRGRLCDSNSSDTETSKQTVRASLDYENNNNRNIRSGDSDQGSGRSGVRRSHPPRNDKNGHFGRGINANTNLRQPSTFHQQRSSTQSSDKNPRLAPYNKSTETGESSTPQPAFVPRPVESEIASRGGNRNIGSSGRQPVESQHQPWNSQVPLGRYVKVHVIYISQSGELFFVLQELMPKLLDLTEELKSLVKQLHSDPKVGDLCMISDEDGVMSRVEIYKIHPTLPKAKVRLIDFGNEETIEFADLMALPRKYWNIKPYAFRATVPSDVEVGEAEDVEVLLSQNENGVLSAKVKMDGGRAAPPPAAQPAPVPSSIRCRTASPARPPHPPPIPKNTFTMIKVVYVGPEGAFGVDHAKLTLLNDIHVRLSELTLRPIQGSPELGRLYAGQYEGEFSRAKVLEVFPNRSCRVLFVDFGNEYNIEIGNMRQIPDELCKDIVTFKFCLDPRSEVQLAENVNLEVTPVIKEPDGSWLMQVKGEPSGNALPDDDDIVAF